VKDGVVADSSTVISGASAGTDTDLSLQHAPAEDAQLGDEYISLTFHESESSEDEDEDEDEEEGDDPNDEEEE
jgi:hypothetical protein